MTSLNNLRNKLTENDNLVIYYAGHGDIDKTDQSAYWLPQMQKQITLLIGYPAMTLHNI